MVEPLFSVPAGWEVTTVAAIAARGGGDVQTGPFGSQLHAADYVQQGIPSVMPQNIGDNTISEEGIARISLEDAKRLARYRLRTGDIVYSRRGDVEKRSLVRPTNDGWLCGTGCLRIRFGEGHVVPEYAAYYLAHPAAKAWVVQHAVGATMPNLNTTILGSLPFVLPPMPEQISIARILGSLDDKIELNRRMNETLEAMAQAIFRDWFVDFGPTRRKLEGATDPLTIMGGLVQDAERAQALAYMFPAALGNDGLPDGWILDSIYGITKVIYGAPFASKQFNDEGRGRPLARIRDLPRHLGGVFTEEVHPKEYLIAPGDIVVGMDGEFRAYLWQGDRTLMNQRICCFSPLDSANRAFVYLGIQPLLAKHETTAIGTTVIHLGKKEIDGFQITSAGKTILQKFSELAEPLVAKIVANGQENRMLAAIRDLLLPKLMSGEIRLSEAEELVEAAQ